MNEISEFIGLILGVVLGLIHIIFTILIGLVILSACIAIVG